MPSLHPAVSSPPKASGRNHARTSLFSANALRFLGLLLAFLPAASAAVAGSGWRIVPPPACRAAAAMAYDSQRGKTILFGGTGDFYMSFQGDTWEWDGSAWRLAARTGPDPRADAGMVYDSARGKTVLFGGSFRDPRTSRMVYLGDTWEWDGNTWTQVITTGPSPRDNVAMAYDSQRGKVVLFGGTFNSSTTGIIYYSDTWEWDGNAWTQVATDGPAARYDAAMAFDSQRGKTILFGGIVKSGGYGTMNCVNDTWEWDGSTWTRVATTGPSPRSGAAMAYDSVRGKALLYGGVDSYSTSSIQGDTWEWDGSAWTEVAATGPHAPGEAAMAYDSARAKMVLFGGYRDIIHDASTGSTWEWDGSAWTQVATSGPKPRTQAAIAYDSARERVLLFGGYNRIEWEFGDTWEWDGNTWAQVAVSGPPIRRGAAMAYDSQRRKMVIFGGDGHPVRSKITYFGDTWEWDGSAWTEVATTGPTPRSDAKMAYDSARGKIVLFGGFDHQAEQFTRDTWEWDGREWTQVATTGPVYVDSEGMAYDGARGKTVLYEGISGPTYGTWEWDGSTWTLITTPGPDCRWRQTMAYDSGRGKILLLGYTVYGVGGMYEWDGNAWTQGPAAEFPPIADAQMAYDSVREQMVLFGGEEGNTWVYTPSPYTLADAAIALRCAAGMVSRPEGTPSYDVTPSGPSAGRVDMEDALLILRQATGLD